MRPDYLHGRGLDDGSRRRRGRYGRYVDSSLFSPFELTCHGNTGWGQYLAQYLTLPVDNDAIAGTSARSYTDAGNFTSIINGVQSGDFVIIEFGHNDGSAGAIDNGREDATGDGYNATTTVVEPE